MRADPRLSPTITTALASRGYALRESLLSDVTVVALLDLYWVGGRVPLDAVALRMDGGWVEVG
jgi:hypothetical protein